MSFIRTCRTLLLRPLIATLGLLASIHLNAQCPTAVSGISATGSTASDGLILIRSRLGLTGAPLIAGTGTTRTSGDVEAAIAAASLQLDVNGSGAAFDISDAAIIARYLAGFRGDALIPTGPGAGATRTTGAAIQAYIDTGCPPPIPVGRTGQMTYFFNNDIFAVNMTTLVSQLRITDNNFQLKYVGQGLGPSNALAVAFNVDNIGNNSQLNIYNANNAIENTFNYSIRFNSAPIFSPDGQTIGMRVFQESGQLGVPPTFTTQFFSRTTGNGFFGLNGSFRFAWMPDGRLVVKFPQGIVILNSLQNLNDNVLIPNTTDALDFSISPNGTKVAFIAAASAQAQSHVYMINIDGTARRQVTTSRLGDEVQAVFSPSGSELLLLTDSCGLVFSSARYVQIVPADATLLDVTASTTPYLLRINGNTRICAETALSWR